MRRHSQSLRCGTYHGRGSICGLFGTRDGHGLATGHAAGEQLAEFMAFDLRDKLHPIGRLEILNAVIAKVQEYYKAFPAQDELIDVSSSAQRTGFSSSPRRATELCCFFLGTRAKIFMITEKNTGVRKIPKKVTPIIPAKTAVPNA
jgi:hypothetical protein